MVKGEKHLTPNTVSAGIQSMSVSSTTPHCAHDEEDSAEFEYLSSAMEELMHVQHDSEKVYGSLDPPTLRSLPCANHNVNRQQFCPKQGLHPCSACRLVSYCSKECQASHWKTHKQGTFATSTRKQLPQYSLQTVRTRSATPNGYRNGVSREEPQATWCRAPPRLDDLHP
jgi:hypothetical protein